MADVTNDDHAERPSLTLLHDEQRIRRQTSYDYWEQQSTDVIVGSLRPEAANPLTAKPNGTVMQGNTRIFVLRQRGVDVDSLPRVIHNPYPTEEWYD